jgi:UDP-N-acetylglucosamine transferase subunit ALG13
VAAVGKVFSQGYLWWSGLLSTFVSVGNATQDFSRLLNAVLGVKEILPQPVTIQYGHTTFRKGGAVAVDFVGMEEFQRLVQDAELVILHAGAGSIITALKAGKVPVVMPRRADFGEHIDDHQHELVDELAAMGRILLAEDENSIREGSQRAVQMQQSLSLHNAPEPELVGLIRQDLKEMDT